MTHSSRSFNAKVVGDLPPIRNPGMISGDEEKLYYHLARTYYRSDRVYFEIGTWLGRSSQRICQGLKAAGPDWKLYCYDSYKWSADYAERARRQGSLGRQSDVVAHLQPGESFMPAFLQLMGDFAPRIEARAGKLKDIATVMSAFGRGEEKIGTLFVDASKGWPENAELLKFFAPKLVARGEAPSIVLYQDFFYFPAYKLIFLLLLMPQMRPIIHTVSGTTLVFEILEPIDPSDPRLQPDAIKQVTEAEVYAAWERLLSWIPDARMKALHTQLALPLMLWECRAREAAAKEFAKLSFNQVEMKFIRSKLNARQLASIPALREMLGATNPKTS